MNTQIGISPDNLADVAHALNSLLADEFLLYTKTANAHWNVAGADFYNMHLFFETQFRTLGRLVDHVADCIHTLGSYAPATLKSILALTHLSEIPLEKNTSGDFIKALLNDHESLIIHLRENIGYFNDLRDFGTNDFITGLMETHEKMDWMLRAHLE